MVAYMEGATRASACHLIAMTPKKLTRDPQGNITGIETGLTPTVSRGR